MRCGKWLSETLISLVGQHDLLLIHGYGRNLGMMPGFVNSNFGLEIRRALRHDNTLRTWDRST